MTVLDQTTPTAHGPSSWIGSPEFSGSSPLAVNATRRDAWAFALAGAISFASSAVGLIVLAHNLSPAEFGLVAMVAPLLVFVMAVSETGLGQTRDRAAGFDHVRSSQSFWRSMALGTTLTAVFVALAPTLAWVFGTLDVLPVAIALAFLFLLQGLKAEHDALCRQCGRMDLWAWAAGTGSVAGLVVAIVLAKGGAGIFSLVAMLLVRAGAHAVLIWAFVGWVPARPHRTTSGADTFQSGASLLTANVVGQATWVIDKVLLGAAKGAAALGSYVLAFQVMLLPLIQLQSSVSGIAASYFQARKDDPEVFGAAIARVSASLAILIWPVAVAAALTADLAVPTLFGEAWQDSAPIFSLLAFASLPFVLRLTLGWAIEARGDGTGMLRWQMMALIAVLIGVIAGLPWGGTGVATGLVAAEFAILSSAPQVLEPALRGAITLMVRSLVRPVALSALAAVAAAEVRMIAAAAPDLVALGLVAVLMLTVGVLSAWQAYIQLLGDTSIATRDPNPNPVTDPETTDPPHAVAP